MILTMTKKFDGDYGENELDFGDNYDDDVIVHEVPMSYVHITFICS